MIVKGAIATACLAVSCVAHAAPAGQEVPTQAGATDVGELVVTGTWDPTTTEITSTSPLDVITARRLNQTGLVDVANALETTEPEISISQAVSQPSISSTRPIALNGLYPDEVLLLVDGMRYHSSAVLNTNTGLGRGSVPYDLNTIPMAAIDHIEVLRDGASAQYGSDAIAGVVNIILKSNDSGGIASAQGGVTGQGDGANGDVWANKGFRLGDNGFLSATAEANIQEATDRAGLDQFYDRKTFWYGNPRVAGVNLALNGGYAGLPFGEVYGDALVSYRASTDRITYIAPVGGYGASIYSSALYPEGYTPQTTLDLFDAQNSIGVRGPAFAGFKYNLNNTFGLSSEAIDIADTVNKSLATATSYGPTSFSNGGPTYWQDVTGLTFAGPLAGAPIAANLTFGGQIRYEHYQIADGSAASIYGLGASGLQGFLPRTPVDNGRTAEAGFIDLELKPASWATVDASGRYDSYSDFGGAPTYKVSGRIALTSWLAFRGSLGTGFRAPSMAQAYYNNTTTTGTGANNTLVNTLTLQATDPIARAIGAQPLKAENSHSYSIGAVLTPTEHLTLTAGLFRIEVDNRIVLTANLPATNPVVAAALANAGVTNVSNVNFFTNALDTRTDGGNLTLAYAGDLGPSTHFLASLAYDRNFTAITRLASDPTAPTLTLFTPQYRLLYTETQPADKLVADFTLDHGPITATLDVTRYGSYVNMPLATPAPQVFAPNWIVNLSGSYKVNSAMTMTIGVLNLFNVYPSRLNEGSSFATYGGSFRYDVSSPDGFNGVAFYGRVSTRF